MLERGLAKLIHETEDAVAPGLAEDVFDGGLRHLVTYHLIEHHLLQLWADLDMLFLERILHHTYIVLDSFGVPLADDIQRIKSDRLGTHASVRTGASREDVGRGAHITPDLLGLLGLKVISHPVHDGHDPAIELFSVCHSLILYVDLLRKQLLPRLLNGVVVDLHLFWEVLLQPLILLNLVPDEEKGRLPRDLNACFAFLPVIEPGLRPPADARLVGVDTHYPRDIEALDDDLKILQGVDDIALVYGLLVGFFFNPSSQVDRNNLCSRAR